MTAFVSRDTAFVRLGPVRLGAFLAGQWLDPLDRPLPALALRPCAHLLGVTLKLGRLVIVLGWKS